VQYPDDPHGPYSIIYAVEYDVWMRDVAAERWPEFVPLTTRSRKCRQDAKYVAKVTKKPVVTARMPLRIPVRDVNEIVLSLCAEFDRVWAGWFQARRAFRASAR
jgi:hypothetical protein